MIDYEKSNNRTTLFISHPKHMVWVLKSLISIAWARKLGSYQSNYVIHEAMNSSICLLLLAGSHAIITPGSVNLEF